MTTLTPEIREILRRLAAAAVDERLKAERKSETSELPRQGAAR
jgi:hypothetical protein